MAAAYAIKPNQLGRCGPKDAHRALYEFVLRPENFSESEIRGLLEQFPVATPFYRLIAAANNISDVFAAPVVEAYWLGNDLLKKVSRQSIAKVIEEDVKREGWEKSQIALMFKALALDRAYAHHSLSVLYFFVRPGLAEKLPSELKLRLDDCRVSAATVIESNGDELLVSYQPLVFDGSRIALGQDQEKRITRGFLSAVPPGQRVSCHLSWGVQILSAEQERALEFFTASSIAAVNGSGERK